MNQLLINAIAVPSILFFSGGCAPTSTPQSEIVGVWECSTGSFTEDWDYKSDGTIQVLSITSIYSYSDNILTIESDSGPGACDELDTSSWPVQPIKGPATYDISINDNEMDMNVVDDWCTPRATIINDCNPWVRTEFTL